MSTHENPLLELGYDIPFDRIRAEHVEPAIEALIERVRAQLTAIGREAPLQRAQARRVTEHADHAIEMAQAHYGQAFAG